MLFKTQDFRLMTYDSRLTSYIKAPQKLTFNYKGASTGIHPPLL